MEQRYESVSPVMVRVSVCLQVICIHPMKWDMDRFPVELMLRSVFLVMDKLLEDEETQVEWMNRQTNG